MEWPEYAIMAAIKKKNIKRNTLIMGHEHGLYPLGV
jgi:hypothetical protein